MRVFVTGATGAIGTHLVERLEAGDGTTVHSLEGDIRDRVSVAAQVAAAAPLDAGFHLAAIVPVKEVEAAPAAAYAVNVAGTAHLMEGIAALREPPYVLHASTCHVYAPSDRPISEADPVAPRNLYAATKYMSETLLRSVCERIGAEVCTARIFSIYDPTQQPPYLLPTMKKRLAEEDLSEPFPLYGADSIRDLTPARQIAAWLVALTEHGSTGIVNVGSGEGTRIADFVQGMTDRTLDIVPRGESDCLVADTRRLKRLLRGSEAGEPAHGA